MARRTSQVDGGSTLPSGTAQPDLPPVEAWGESNLDQRPAKSRSPNGEWSSTLPSPRRSAQLIRATGWLSAPILPTSISTPSSFLLVKSAVKFSCPPTNKTSNRGPLAHLRQDRLPYLAYIPAISRGCP